VVAGFGIQFSELAKILMILVFAGFLAGRQAKVKSVWTVIVPIHRPGATVDIGHAAGQTSARPLVLVAEPLVGMLFMSGASLRWLGTLAVAVAAASRSSWANLQHYQRSRLLALINQGQDPKGSGYQLDPVRGGGSRGRALGKGLTKRDCEPRRPRRPTSSGASLAQELGFLGSMVVLALFVLLLWRLLVCSWRSTDQFRDAPRLWPGIGWSSSRWSSTSGMVIGLLPITGIPLPFVT